MHSIVLNVSPNELVAIFWRFSGKDLLIVSRSDYSPNLFQEIRVAVAKVFHTCYLPYHYIRVIYLQNSNTESRKYYLLLDLDCIPKSHK